jgi:dihydropteroate synthase
MTPGECYPEVIRPGAGFLEVSCVLREKQAEMDSMYEWRLPDRTLTIGRRPLILGIINVTPDSFSDGGQHATAQAAIEHGRRLIEQGADLLDIGGESTRPGATPVPVEEELRRVLPVVQRLAATHSNTPLSVDTSKAEVARQCLQAGARIINDVTALTGDPAMAEVVRDARAGLILMHMQGTPLTMQQAPHYENVVEDIRRYLGERLNALEAAGIARDYVALDPGIGFGKTLEHTLEMLGRLREFQQLGRPVCLGVSRKGFIGQVVGGRPRGERLAGSIAVALHAVAHQAAQIVRVHDVLETRDALLLFDALEQAAEAAQAR